MRDLLNQMFQLPANMARVGAEQIISFMERAGGTLSESNHDSWESEQGDNLWKDGSSDPFQNDEPASAHASAQPNSSFANTPEIDVAESETPAQTIPPHDLLKTTSASVNRGHLDLTTMIAIGDGLLAGEGDFSLASDEQEISPCAQLAAMAGNEFIQPLFESIELSSATSRRPARFRFPDLRQSKSFCGWSHPAVNNLSIPRFKVADCLELVTTEPVVQPDDLKQSLANLVLTTGRQQTSRTTQLDRALSRNPTFMIVCLGFWDFAEPLFQNSPKAIPTADQFMLNWSKLFDQLEKEETQSAFFNVANPLNTAAFSTLTQAAKILKVGESFLQSEYRLANDDLLSVSALTEIGTQINRRQIRPLVQEHFVTGTVARSLTTTINDVNDRISQRISGKEFAILVDIAGLYSGLNDYPIEYSGGRLSAEYLGGFFSLNGYSVGATGNAAIANQLISLLNSKYDASIPLVDLAKVAASDPVTQFKIAAGRNWSDEALNVIPRVSSQSDSEECSEGHDDGWLVDGEELDNKYNLNYRQHPQEPIRLPESMDLILELNPRKSYQSDAMRILNCRRQEDVQWGRCGNQAFDGLAMFGAYLNGQLRFQFSPAVNHIAKFSLHLDAPLTSKDGELSTPHYLRFPLLSPHVVQPPGLLSSGSLDLRTGEVIDMDLLFMFNNSGLAALQSMNPTSFPSPAIIRFKTKPKPDEGYCTSLARFIQQPNGRLDFIFHGTSFVPMGPGFRFALPFGDADGSFASVPANGTQLHPHLHLNTSPSNSKRVTVKPFIPTNQIREFNFDVSRTSFGDDFTLNHPDIGNALGRSHLTGRLMIQFGERFGDHVPFSVSMLPAGGATIGQNVSALQQVFPGRLSQGATGHDSVLRFPCRTYRQNDLYLLDDPFDLAVGAVNVFTGEVIGDFVHRGLLGQALFYTLLRVEPRTPKGSFEYRGPAAFRLGKNGQLNYRFNGTFLLPYKERFKWPLTNGVDSVEIGPKSQLDPFFQIDANSSGTKRGMSKSGSGSRWVAPTGEIFSFRYSVSNISGKKSSFTFTNHSHKSKFELESLSWISFNESQTAGEQSDIVTFCGLGTWSADKTSLFHEVVAQFSTNKNRPYASVLIDGGLVTSINSVLESEVPPLTAWHGDKKGNV